MWTIFLVVLIILMLGGWGYGRARGGTFVNPMGAVGLILLVLLVVLLYRGSP